MFEQLTSLVDKIVELCKLCNHGIKFIQAMNSRRDVYDFPHHRSTNSQSFGKPVLSFPYLLMLNCRSEVKFKKSTQTLLRGVALHPAYFIDSSRASSLKPQLLESRPLQSLVLALDMEFLVLFSRARLP